MEISRGFLLFCCRAGLGEAVILYKITRIWYDKNTVKRLTTDHGKIRDKGGTRMLIGGLDIGTSGCKITVYNEKGDFIEKQYREYASKHAQDVHEIDAEAIYQAVGT
ncbi:MAG: hypothetical protein ACLTXL_02080 [Clostridia bacterium]